MNNIEFFNLLKNGDSAIVRILNTDVSKIEVKNVHPIFINGKKKKIACLGEDKCPLCKTGQNTPNARLYVHLFDYTDNKEKVWDRTPNENFLNSLREVVDSWGDLYNCVLKITRNGDDFPKYSVTVLNPNKYPIPDSVSKSSIDETVAYRFSTYRSEDELNEFIRTGVLPDHVKKQTEWVPKDEWIRRKKEEENNKNGSSNNTNNVKDEYKEEVKKSVPNNFDDPFV